MSGRDEPVTVTAYPDGPLLVRGEIELHASDGTVIDPPDAPWPYAAAGSPRSSPSATARTRRPASAPRTEQGQPSGQ